MPSFNDFSLLPSTRAVLATMEFTEPTPIQAEAIPALLAGNDVVGQSVTGSGKTLAYGIPLVERVAKDQRVPQALVLVPTRELAMQVHSVLGKLATSRRLSLALLVGGRPYANQISALRYGAQIVVGTPGRVKDHLDRGTLVLDSLRVCVLDEADQMLDIGFAPVIEEILTTSPETRQTALFSATMPDWVKKLEQKFLKNPIRVAITPAKGAESTIEQIAYQVPQDQKMAALCTLLHSTEGESTLIFGKTKFGVEKLGKQLNRLGFTVGTLHGNKSQSAREKVLAAFRNGQVQTLLATNVAARGLDITGIHQVINYELPESSELFTHRIGRTGRMGRQGKAITLLIPSDVPKWRQMSRSLGQKVALQKLAIDEEAMEAQSLPMPEAEDAIAQEQEQRVSPKPGRERKQFSSNQDSERRRSASPKHDKHDSQAESSLKRRKNQRVTRETPEWEPEDFTLPERAYSRKARDSRRVADKQSSFSKNMGKRNTASFAAPAAKSEHRAEKRKPRAIAATSTAPTRARRTVASRRFASR